MIDPCHYFSVDRSARSVSSASSTRTRHLADSPTSPGLIDNMNHDPIVPLRLIVLDVKFCLNRTPLHLFSLSGGMPQGTGSPHPTSLPPAMTTPGDLSENLENFLWELFAEKFLEEMEEEARRGASTLPNQQAQPRLEAVQTRDASTATEYRTPDTSPSSGSPGSPVNVNVTVTQNNHNGSPTEGIDYVSSGVKECLASIGAVMVVTTILFGVVLIGMRWWRSSHEDFAFTSTQEDAIPAETIVDEEEDDYPNTDWDRTIQNGFKIVTIVTGIISAIRSVRGFDKMGYGA